ncbi:MAG: hisC [Ignavibacteria bacterium]|nr:hisC [Ignavibacteria bacterium]
MDKSKNLNIFSIPRNIIELEPYKPGRTIEEIKREYGLNKVIKLASNENPLGVSPLAIQAMFASINQINRYPDITSSLLCAKLSEVFNISIDNIITAHGSEAIIQVIMRTFLLETDEVITASGTFVGFYVIAQARGVRMKLVPLKDYRFDLNAIANAITEKTKLIYLVNPNSPTGNYFTKTEFGEFLKLVPENVLIILDEAYFEFVKERDDFPDSLNYSHNNIITLRTFSKAYGLAGMRIGYGFANPEFIKLMMKVKLPFEPGIPQQAAGVAALSDKQFLDYYLEMNRTGREYFYDCYNKLGIEYIKSDTNFVMSIFDSEDRVINITEKLLRKGIIVRPLKAFRLPHCIRVTVGLPEENEIYCKALQNVL